MNLHVVDPNDVKFPSVPGPDLDLRVDPDRLRELIRDADEAVRDDARAGARSAWAVASILGRAMLGESWIPEPAVLGEIADWMTGNPVGTHMFWYRLHEFLPGVVPDLALAIVDVRPTAVAWAYAACAVVKPEARTKILHGIAGFRLDSVREHFFALLGQHRRLVPPGSIPTRGLPADVLGDVLRIGITDRVAKVRERAIAAAYGMNAIALVRDEVMAATEDPEMAVRQYALVALGTLDDGASLARLHDRLAHGTREEMTSAVWALARRPDGLGTVLARVGDERPWLRGEVLSALAEVAAPMTDAQLAAVRAAVTTPDLERVLDRHVERTRRGGREHGPDGQWLVMRTAPPPDATGS